MDHRKAVYNIIVNSGIDTIANSANESNIGYAIFNFGNDKDAFKAWCVVNSYYACTLIYSPVQSGNSQLSAYSLLVNVDR